MGLIGRSECSSGLRQSVGQVGVLGCLNSDGVSSSFDGIARLIAPVLPALLPARAPPPPEKKFPNSTPPGALSPRASGSVRSDRVS